MKVHLFKAMVFPVVMYGCESWTLKKAECRRIDAFWTVVLEKTLESSLDGRKVKPVNPKGNQSWIFVGGTNGEALILWPPNAKNCLIGKDPDAGKDWRQGEKGMTVDELVGWHHQLNGRKFEQAPGVGDGQESLMCCSPWGFKESDTTEQLNWTELLEKCISKLQLDINSQQSEWSSKSLQTVILVKVWREGNHLTL